MVGRFLRSLVDELHDAWRARAWSEAEFPALAAESLTRARPADAFDGDALLRWAIESHSHARGQHAAAEVLPLWSGARLEIHAHLWLDTIAPPHDHGWAGAFTLVEGRSLDGRHQFEVHEGARAGLAFGALRRAGLELLGAGDTVAVRPGPALIHSVQHLDRPGVAISVRTRRRARPSTTYFRPGLALGDQAVDDELRARLRALSLMRSLDPDPDPDREPDDDRFVEGLAALLRGGELRASFMGLSEAVQAGWTVEPELLRVGEEALGPRFAAIVGALDDLRAYQELVDLRGEHREADMRGFLAALYLSAGRRELLETLESLGIPETPETPELWDWIGAQLVKLLVDTDTDAELPSFLARGLGGVARGRPAEQLREDLRDEHGAEVRDEHLEFLELARASLASSPLFRCLAAP